MFWIESSGGPLVMMEKQLRNEWGGIDKSSDVHFISDYDRACSTDGYAAKLLIPSGEVVVFGDEPNRTTVFRNDEKEVTVVRWRWALDESTVHNSLKKLNKTKLQTIEQIQVRFKDGKLVIFDSSCNGLGAIETLSIVLVPGNFIIETVMYEPDNETCLLLHKLRHS